MQSLICGFTGTLYSRPFLLLGYPFWVTKVCGDNKKNETDLNIQKRKYLNILKKRISIKRT
jgi:hypothetical protein